MGYYASGGGVLYFKNCLPEEARNQVSELLDSAWMEYYWDQNGKEADCWLDDKYRYDTGAILNQIACIAKIDSACLKFGGEDGTYWKFQYDTENHCFNEIEGSVVFADENQEVKLERITDILCRYVDNDLNSADPEWVREVLVNCCGCTSEELKEIGLDYIFPDDYWGKVD